MGKQLIINSGRNETRIALLEESSFVEFYIERGSNADILGNIYKGRVNRVLPGMQAAFVDIGLEKAAFLHAVDVQDDTKLYEMLMNGENNHDDENLRVFPAEQSAIEELLTEGQEILIQITKEPIGTKGARASSHISLPGRYLVYLPASDHIGISRKIEDENERTRLRKIVEDKRPDRGGFIIRTASIGVDAEEITADMKSLTMLWPKIRKKGEKARPMALIHEEVDITIRVIRDLLSADISEIVIDSKEGYEKITSFMDVLMQKIKSRVKLYERDELIFEHYDIEMEIDDLLHEKVWLKSGGYIIIETTEALTAIDVNTGRFTGKKNLEETILKTNLEAAKEIAYQLRLRNIGGIIIIDYIDMIRQDDKDKTFQAMNEALKKDRAITRVSEISELGLLEMTRKRIRNNIVKVMCDPCEYCDGRGHIKSKTSISLDILRDIEKEVLAGERDKIFFQVHPEISDTLLDEFYNDIHNLEKKYKMSIIIKENPSLHLEDYHIQQ